MEEKHQRQDHLSALEKAINERNVALVKQHLKKVKDVNNIKIEALRELIGKTVAAIPFYSKEAHQERENARTIFKLLVDKGLKLNNDRGAVILQYFIDHQDQELANYCLNHKASVGKPASSSNNPEPVSALETACSTNNFTAETVEIVKALLKKKADTNDLSAEVLTSLLIKTTDRSSRDSYFVARSIFRSLVENGLQLHNNRGAAILQYFIDHKDKEMFDLCLNAGASVGKFISKDKTIAPTTALEKACLGNLDATSELFVTALLKKGADVRTVPEEVITNLIAKAKNRHVYLSERYGTSAKNILTMLIDKGVPLGKDHFLSLHESEDNELLALCEKAIPHAKQSAKGMLLHYAYAEKNQEQFTQLIKLGADLSVKGNESKKTVLEKALDQADSTNVTLLLKRGALLSYTSDLPTLGETYDLKGIPVHPDVTKEQLEKTGAKNPDKAIRLTREVMHKNPGWQRQWSNVQANKAKAEEAVKAVNSTLSDEQAAKVVSSVKQAKNKIEPFMQTRKNAEKSFAVPTVHPLPYEVTVNILSYVAGESEKTVHQILQKRSDYKENTLAKIVREVVDKPDTSGKKQETPGRSC